MTQDLLQDRLLSARIKLIFAWLFAVIFGGLVGRFLLDSLNDVDPEVRLDQPINTAETPPARTSRRVVFILLDGVTVDAWDRIAMGEQRPFPIAWSGIFDTGTPSLSRPGYHVVLTGVDQAISAIRTNAYVGPSRQDTFVDRARASGGTVAWALDSVQWFYELAGRPTDARLRGADADDVAKVLRLYENGANLLIVHWTRTDGVGHDHGSASEPYHREVRASVERVRQLYAGLMAHTTDGTQLSIYVGSDHGHLPAGGHGGPEPSVRRVRWSRLATEQSELESTIYSRSLESSGAMAATVANALGVPWPQHTLHPAVLDREHGAADVTVERAAAVRRSAQMWARWERARVQQENARNKRALAYAVLWVLAAIYAIKLGRGRQWFGAWVVPLGALLGYAAVGPGWSLSAIRTHVSFLVHALGVMAAGAIVAAPIAQRLKARGEHIAIASGLTSLLPVLYCAGSVGRSYLGDVGMVIAPAMGLVPLGCMVAMSVMQVLSVRRRKGTSLAS